MRILQQQKKYQQQQFPMPIGGSMTPDPQPQGQQPTSTSPTSQPPGTPSSLPSTPVGGVGTPTSVMRPTRLSPTKLTPSLPLQKAGGNGQKSPTKRMPSPLRSPSPTKVIPDSLQIGQLLYLLQVKHQVDFPEEIMYILIFLKVKLSNPPMHLV